MKCNTKCPEADELQQLLAGTLTELRLQEYTEHMDSCEGCQHRLEGLATSGTNLSQLVAHLNDSEPAAQSGYWAAAQQLEVAVQETFVPRASARLGGNTLDFLAPAVDSAYIGRLAQFDVMRIIGRGGMGLVLEAFDTRLQRNVAVKVLDPVLAEEEISRQRFCREARAAASVTHENVVAVHQVEKSADGKLPYLVMQLISGESLEQRLLREPILPVREVLRIGMQVARGLAAAYAQGLIHRDIKPGNILLESSHDNVKLTDFGLARAVDDVKLTRTGFVSGTPLYMSPEQAMGADADHRSDLFSVGAVMYEMCTGQPPFTGGSALAVLKQISDSKHRPLRDLNPEIPEWMADTIDRLLAKKPDDRIQTAEQLAELLEFQLARIRSSEDVPTVCKIEAEKEARRNRWIAAGIGASFLTVGLFAGMYLANRPRVPQDSVVAAPQSPEPVAVLNANSGAVWTVAFDPSGQTVAMGVEDGSMRLWDLPTQSIKSSLKAHRSAIWSAQFSPEGDMLATAGDDGQIEIWNPLNSERIKGFKSPYPVRSLVFSPDSKTLFSGDRDGALRAWSLETGQTIHDAQQPSAIYTVAISPDGETIASAGNNKTIYIWNAKTLQLKTPLEGHSGSIYSLSFSPDGKHLASAGWDKQIRIWDVGKGSLTTSWDGRGSDIWGVAYSPDGTKLVTAGHDGAVRLWNASTQTLEQTYLGHKISVHSLAFSRDGSLIASGSRDGSIRVWSTKQ